MGSSKQKKKINSKYRKYFHDDQLRIDRPVLGVHEWQ